MKNDLCIDFLCDYPYYLKSDTSDSKNFWGAADYYLSPQQFQCSNVFMEYKQVKWNITVPQTLPLGMPN